MAPARYDDVADFYEAGWADERHDDVLDCLFDLLGLTGLHKSFGVWSVVCEFWMWPVVTAAWPASWPEGVPRSRA